MFSSLRNTHTYYLMIKSHLIFLIWVINNYYIARTTQWYYHVHETFFLFWSIHSCSLITGEIDKFLHRSKMGVGQLQNDDDEVRVSPKLGLSALGYIFRSNLILPTYGLLLLGHIKFGYFNPSAIPFFPNKALLLETTLHGWFCFYG